MRVRAEERGTAVACYREFAPSEHLREHVRAFFTFMPAASPEERGPARRRVTWQTVFESGDPFVSPLFADANPSIVVNLGLRCGTDGVWVGGDAPSANVIGAMTGVGPPTAPGHAVMVGVYFQPARASQFIGLPLCELTDRIVTLEDLWGSAGADLPAQLDDMSDTARVDCLESELLRRLGRRHASRTSVDVPGLTEWTLRSRGQLSVERLADAAGVSRQHLSRVFHELVGVSPKLFCRLARFHSALGFLGGGERVEWARVAAALGYADQSHMIAEFREFSSLTPHQIASARLFHPFIENARTSHGPSV
jgi:AraC-like DNA-binding protein